VLAPINIFDNPENLASAVDIGQQMVELGYVESVSHETIRQTLKKTS